MLPQISSISKALAAGLAAMLIAIPAVFSVIGASTGGGDGVLDSRLPSAKAASVGGDLTEKRTIARDEALASFEFTQTDLPQWNGSYANTSCYANNTFTVKTPEDFAYAVTNASAGMTISLQEDIDMGGRSGRNFLNDRAWNGITLAGNGHTVFNLNIEHDMKDLGLCTTMSNCVVESITFESTRIIGSCTHLGIFPLLTGLGSNINEFHATQGIFYNTNLDETALAGIVAPFGMIDTYDRDTIVQNSGSSHCTSIGNWHIGGFISGYDGSVISDCYSDNNLVISYGGHGGAFAACANEYSQFYRCWSNSTIYGNSSVGGFTSGCDGNGVLYQDCWSSGIVEGEKQIGGFCGLMLYYTTATHDWVANNCYTTAMVGMNYNGENLGGFAGCTSEEYSSSGSHRTVRLTNCYAAGEVGSIDTDPATSTNNGGFIGRIDPAKPFVASNCFYDMQTTAMKAKAVGTAAELPLTRDETGISTGIYNGIKGVTTRKLAGEFAVFPNGYTYTSGLYPQLASMTSHTDIAFRAASAASATTVFCDEWPGSDHTGFDTVRDTMRNYCFSSVEEFGSNTQFSAAHVRSDTVADIKWETDGNVSPINETMPVIQLAEHPYFTTALSPGIEWVEATLRYEEDGTTAIGNRKLRLIPTSAIEAGRDGRIDIPSQSEGTETPAYNHATGFDVTYLDATTLKRYMDSDTAHTEALLTFDQVVEQEYDSGTITGRLPLPFNSIVGDLAITTIVTDMQGIQADIDNLYAKLNGQALFESSDCGMYRITYKAQLPDGRYLQATKKLVVTGAWAVIYNYNYNGLLEGDRIFPDSIFYTQSNLTSFDGFVLGSYGEPPIRDGYAFSYWSMDQAGTSPASQEWFDAYEERFGALDENIELWAQWKSSAPGSVTLTIDPAQGSYVGNEPGSVIQISGHPGEKVVIGDVLPPALYAFKEWRPAEEATRGVLTFDERSAKWVFEFDEANAMITAEYVRTSYTVTWIDEVTGYVIRESVVPEGNDAVPPAAPHHSGYVFAGYDSDAWHNVSADMTVRVLYTWDIIEVPETGGSGHWGVMAGIAATCIASCAAVCAFIVRREELTRSGTGAGKKKNS